MISWTACVQDGKHVPPRLNQTSLMSPLPRFQDVGNPIIPNTSFLSCCQADLKVNHSQIHCPKFQPSSPQPTLHPVPPTPTPRLPHTYSHWNWNVPISLFLLKIRFSFYVTNHLNTFRKLLATNLNLLGWTNLKISLSGHPFKQRGHFIPAQMSASVSLFTTSQQMN